MPSPPKPPTSPKPPSKRIELTRWLEAHRPERVGVEEWQALQTELAPISTGYLRKLLRASGVPLHPLVEGVRQEDLVSLERTLLALLGEERRVARTLIIEAKDHARWASKKHPEKAEMILWMLTWLENPGVFHQWLAIRKDALRAQNEATEITGA
jgi:hypothetical protein